MHLTLVRPRQTEQRYSASNSMFGRAIYVWNSRCAGELIVRRVRRKKSNKQGCGRTNISSKKQSEETWANWWWETGAGEHITLVEPMRVYLKKERANFSWEGDAAEQIVIDRGAGDLMARTRGYNRKKHGCGWNIIGKKRRCKRASRVKESVGQLRTRNKDAGEIRVNKICAHGPHEIPCGRTNRKKRGGGGGVN